MEYNWSNKTVLIVEDTHINCLLYKAMLEGTGIKIVIAENSQTFFDVFKKEIYDVILMDINLGEKINGLDLIKHLQKNNIYTPVIIQTAFSIQYPIDDDIKYHAMVNKPINFTALKEIINDIFNKNDKKTT
jgi:DNA-binding NtrC family response regulator